MLCIDSRVARTSSFELWFTVECYICFPPSSLSSPAGARVACRLIDLLGALEQFVESSKSAMGSMDEGDVMASGDDSALASTSGRTSSSSLVPVARNGRAAAPAGPFGFPPPPFPFPFLFPQGEPCPLE